MQTDSPPSFPSDNPIPTVDHNDDVDSAVDITVEEINPTSPDVDLTVLHRISVEQIPAHAESVAEPGMTDIEQVTAKPDPKEPTSSGAIESVEAPVAVEAVVEQPEADGLTGAAATDNAAAALVEVDGNTIEGTCETTPEAAEIPPAQPTTPNAVIEAGGLQSGQLVLGEVLSVDANEVVIQLPDGRRGVIGRRHLTVDGKSDPTEVVQLGESIETAVLVREDRENRVVLSRTWALKQRAWAAIEGAISSGEPVKGVVVELVKGGLTVDIGVRAFLPASQVDLHHVEDLATLLGTEIDCLVVEADRVTDKVVVSRRNWLRQIERRQASELAATLEAGQIRRGRVVTVTDFGAFVDLGGVRGLLHLSELSWNRVEKTSDVVSVGQEIDVQILSLKGGSKRISLSLRAVKPDPLGSLLEGERLLGVVTRLVDFGAFVRIKDDVEGLVHVSELAEYRVHLPEEVVTPGDEVWVKVLRIDRKRRRVDLSVNQAVMT